MGSSPCSLRQVCNLVVKRAIHDNHNDLIDLPGVFEPLDHNGKHRTILIRPQDLAWQPGRTHAGFYSDNSFHLNTSKGDYAVEFMQLDPNSMAYPVPNFWMPSVPLHLEGIWGGVQPPAEWNAHSLP